VIEGSGKLGRKRQKVEGKAASKKPLYFKLVTNPHGWKK
jgi:hypothetical protein